MWYVIYFKYADMIDEDRITVYSESRLKQILQEYQSTGLCKYLAYSTYKHQSKRKIVYTNFSQEKYKAWKNGDL